MALKFDMRWRFDPPSGEGILERGLPDQAATEFIGLARTIATQGNRWSVFETFKAHFSVACDRSHSTSSNEGWAESDMQSMMYEASGNTPRFIEAFYDTCEVLRKQHPDWMVPDVEIINHMLARHSIPFSLRPPELVFLGAGAPLVEVPTRPPTLAERALDVFQTSLQRSEQLLSEGNGREAVQELLWLLESVSTAFKGLDTASGKVEGGYFNQIVKDLRAKRKGTTLERVLEWTTALHGYLSSPTGGGVRHGLVLNTGVALGPQDARLYANLIRSYLTYLLAEHEALSKAAPALGTSWPQGR